MHKTLIFILLFAYVDCFSQQNDTIFFYNPNHTDSISADSIESILETLGGNDFYNTKWFTIGSHYDLVNSTFGLLISNGYNERPLIHFEDFSENLTLKIQGTTDFQKDYSFGASAAYRYPIRYVSSVSIDYNKFNYSLTDFKHQNINFSAKTGIKYVNVGLKIGFGHQKLNDFHNLGMNIGLQKVLIYRKLYTTVSCGYYSNYWTWSAKIQGFLYSDLIGIVLKYDRIDTYDFFNLGLIFTFER